MRLLNARHAADLLMPMVADGAGETLAVAILDADRRLLGTMCVPGFGDQVVLPIREVLAQALRMDARGLVIAHNHPSGDPQPSPEDVAATLRLATTKSTCV
jgi:DNA repair protein RadC